MLNNRQTQPRLFFCHIPKTAGLTLRHILASHFRESEIFPITMMDDFPDDFPMGTMGRYRLIQGHFLWSSIAGLLGEPLTTVTMLRDPIERILSSYDHTRRSPEHAMHELIGGSAATVSDFIEKMYPAGYINTHLFFLSGIPAAETTLAAEKAYLGAYAVDPRRYESLDNAKALLERIAFFGISERFEDSLEMLSHTLGWQPMGAYQSLNVSGERIRSQDLDAVTLERLREYNQLDYALYEYGTKLFEERYKQMVRRMYWESYNYRRRRTPMEREVTISFDDAMEGDGWYPRETAPNGKIFRWMGPQKRGLLYAHLLPSEQMEFSMAVYHVFAEEMLDLLQVKVNGQALKLTRTFSKEEQAIIISARFSGKVIEAAADEMSVIELSVPYTRSGRDVDAGNADQRQVSIAVHWVKIGGLG